VRAAPEPVVTIVTVTYQSSALIGACLDSIQQHAGLPTRVVVVDNASTDGTAGLIAERYPWVELMTPERNLGFAAATNLGIERAQTPYVLLLNPDTELRPGALPRLLDELSRDPTVAAAGPSLVYPDGTPQDAAFTYPTLLMTWLEFFPRPGRLLPSRLNGRLRSPDGRPIEIHHPLGAAMLVRRSAWEEVGPLDEGFFMYCEEVDWCMRARELGWRILHVPAATVVHHGGASTSQVPAASLGHLYASRKRLHRKHRDMRFWRVVAAITRRGLQRERDRALVDVPEGGEPDPAVSARVQAIDEAIRKST
jgi:N-acetylglucosaminyl-diphospho-decaprenol L-rhamnosyltransferase